VFPFGRSIQHGVIRPDATTGVGVTVISVDLDNINDQEIHGLRTWNVGGGAKLMFGVERNYRVDIRFQNHRLYGGPGVGDIDLRSVSVGIGYRF
jgi:hypothetical protein